MFSEKEKDYLIDLLEKCRPVKIQIWNIDAEHKGPPSSARGRNRCWFWLKLKDGSCKFGWLFRYQSIENLGDHPNANEYLIRVEEILSRSTEIDLSKEIDLSDFFTKDEQLEFNF